MHRYKALFLLDLFVFFKTATDMVITALSSDILERTFHFPNSLA